MTIAFCGEQNINMINPAVSTSIQSLRQDTHECLSANLPKKGDTNALKAAWNIATKVRWLYLKPIVPVIYTV